MVVATEIGMVFIVSRKILNCSGYYGNINMDTQVILVNGPIPARILVGMVRTRNNLAVVHIFVLVNFRESDLHIFENQYNVCLSINASFFPFAFPKLSSESPLFFLFKYCRYINGSESIIVIHSE